MIKDTPIRVVNDSTNETRELYWDEDNRLMVLSDNGKTSCYTYNAAGERIMKSYGTMEGVYINGAPQGITLTDVDFRLHQDKMSKLFCAWFALKFHETDNFTLYPASILSVNKNRFTKHYFIGDKRVASRIGTGMFNNVYGRNGSYVTAGQQDYAERMNQIQTQKEACYKKVGVAPGVPTEKGAYSNLRATGNSWTFNILENREKRKQIIILITFIIFPFQIGKANSFISLKNDIDTSIVIQTQRQKCIIVQLINKFTDTEGLTKILLIKKDKKKLISKTLPSADDVKNLNISINKYRTGFILKAQYGGGDNFYNRDFYFKWIKSSFFLYKIVGTHAKPNFTKSIITVKNILPFINIRDFNIQCFLENTP